jgi:16S rRNA processing protein RimM
VTRPERLEVGRVDRPHGLTGEVVVTMISDRPERVRPGARLDADGRPLVVRSARPHRHRWLICFEGIDDREAAETLRGAVLRGEPIADPEAWWVDELCGAEVLDPTGRRHGRVVAVEANPASDLLVLEDGRLVPLRFAVERRPGVVVVDVPAGLLDDATEEA